MQTASARHIRREAAKLNPKRKRTKLTVDRASYFTKKHTEARKLHLPAYAALKADRKTLAKAAGIKAEGLNYLAWQSCGRCNDRYRCFSQGKQCEAAGIKAEG